MRERVRHCGKERMLRLTVGELLSAAGRYDHYSDVGGTFNPKFGATFKPVDWVSIRGSWGKSFVAPSLADGAVADPTVTKRSKIMRTVAASASLIKSLRFLTS